MHCMIRPGLLAAGTRSRVARRSVAHAALVLVAALALASCDSNHVLSVDQPPTVTLTSGPVDTVSAPQSWLVDIAWTASDPDGRIDHFEYVIDPPTLKLARMAAAETAWVSTHEQHMVARFRASHRETPAGTIATEFHTFALRAVDDRGARSAIVARSFYATTIAPDVKITRPVPSALLIAQVPSPFRAEWEGYDPDGAGSTQPVSYRVLVKSLNDPENQVYLRDPDSLWREGDRSGWSEWTTLPGDSTSMTFVPNIPPTGSGVLAVLAVDEAGATTPYLNLNENFLQFTVAYPGTSAPRIHLWSTAVDFNYQTGGYSTDPLREVPVEVGANVPLTFHWEGLAAAGRTVVSTRWMLDGDIADDTPRSGPDDLAHWSTRTPPPGVADVPGLAAGQHRLYLEVTDDFGEKSLAIVRIDVVFATLQSDLLVVNDTRLEVDKFSRAGTTVSLNPYTQPWPSAAELDTFLFARGGVPWRNTQNPTTGALSTAGLLEGYTYDTLGTRLGLEEAGDAVRLSTLARYRHVLWLVDHRGAENSEYGDPNLFPSTALRSMSEPGKASQLSAYIGMGGEVWLAGGGAAYASLVGFNRRINDAGATTVFSVSEGELGPGRAMYDAAHVRSALGSTRTNTRFERSPAAIGGWSGHGPDGTLSAPDYSRLPGALRFRDPGIDPLPPTRLPQQASLYYGTSTTAEYVFEPNSVSEDFGVPGTPRIESALDTLYNATGGVLLIDPAPAMIYYHGRDNAPIVFTGFELWSWTRSDCQALVDFVLGDIWKLTKSPSRAGARPASTMLRTPRPATTRVSARLDPRRMRP